MKWIVMSLTLAWVVLEDLSVAQMVKNLPAMWETRNWSLGQEAPWRREWQSNLAWRISLTEESGGLQSMGSQRVEHDWVTNTFSLSDMASDAHILIKEPQCIMKNTTHWHWQREQTVRSYQIYSHISHPNHFLTTPCWIL